MKNKDKKLLAKKIVKLEQRMRQDKTDKSAEQEIEKILSSLSLEDILELDEYIFSKNLLTK